MNTKAREIWYTTTTKGTKRAWFYSYAAIRVMPVALKVAESEILSGAAILSTKPEFVS